MTRARNILLAVLLLFLAFVLDLQGQVSFLVTGISNVTVNITKFNTTDAASVVPVAEDVPIAYDAARPMPLHVIQVGPPRTATTLQFQCVCLSVFLRLENGAAAGFNGTVETLKRMRCEFFKSGTPRFEAGRPKVYKAHYIRDFKKYLSSNEKRNTWIFLTAESRRAVQTTRHAIEKDGFPNVMYVQDLETVSEKGLHIVDNYAKAFGLTSRQRDELFEYIRYWDILRICCGKQMSKKWRNELFSDENPKKNEYKIHEPKYHACPIYDIDAVESAYMSTPLYQRISKVGAPGMKNILGPSTVDQGVFGSYCSRYNELVRKQGVGFNEGSVEQDEIRDEIQKKPVSSYQLD